MCVVLTLNDSQTVRNAHVHVHMYTHIEIRKARCTNTTHVELSVSLRSPRAAGWPRGAHPLHATRKAREKASVSSFVTSVAPHCVNTLRILHAAYDATSLSLSLLYYY